MSIFSDSKRLHERSMAPTRVARGRVWPVLTAVLLAIFAVAGLAETSPLSLNSNLNHTGNSDSPSRRRSTGRLSTR